MLGGRDNSNLETRGKLEGAMFSFTMTLAFLRIKREKKVELMCISLNKDFQQSRKQTEILS